jgi:hypothetical protein
MILDSPFLSHLYIYTERSYTGTSGTSHANRTGGGDCRMMATITLLCSLVG